MQLTQTRNSIITDYWSNYSHNYTHNNNILAIINGKDNFQNAHEHEQMQIKLHADMFSQ